MPSSFDSGIEKRERETREDADRKGRDRGLLEHKLPPAIHGKNTAD